MQSLIPEDFATKLEGARAAQTMVGERRIVTMLFCDIKGSTVAAEQLDPEDWAEIMNGAFEYMIRPVYKYEGMVARLMGDAVLAFFGAPISHEDDPQRAIMAGLEIIEGIELYKYRMARDWGLEIDVRVGINTGLVMVGSIGSDLRMEYTAMGDAINLASRMEQSAEAGTIQVAEDTYRIAAPVFDWQELGEVEVKGKSEPIRTFRPLRRSVQPGSLRGIEGLDSPLIGRDKELEKLKSAADQLEKGFGGIIFVEGEAGLGKSRLVEEFHRYLHVGDKDRIDWQENCTALCSFPKIAAQAMADSTKRISRHRSKSDCLGI
jgi:class 3 adenylate cyclase